MVKRILLIGLLAVWFAGEMVAQDSQGKLVRLRLLVNRGQCSEALAFLQQDGITASDATSRYVLGLVRSCAGDYAGANEMLEQVDGYFRSAAALQMAKNYIKLGDESNALNYLRIHLSGNDHLPEKTLLRDPDFSTLSEGRGWASLWQNDWYSPAEQKADECEYLLRTGRIDEAEDLYLELSNHEPFGTYTFYVGSLIESARLDDRKSAQLLMKSWKSSDAAPALKVRLLNFALDQELTELASVFLSEMLSMDPTNPDWLTDAAMIRINQGSEARIEGEIGNLESMGLQSADVYYSAGRHLVRRNPVQAEKYLDLAVEAGLLDAGLFRERGYLRSSLDKPESALEDLAMSLDINPDQPDVYFFRANIRYELGDTEGACHDWKKAAGLGHREAIDSLYRNCR